MKRPRPGGPLPGIPERLQAALSDRYRLQRELGQGGMATVYLARDLRHDRDVAIKVLRPQLAEAIGPDRFLREIHIAAGLRHPHIVPLYDSGDAAGFLFYVMPYETGQSLRQRMAEAGELSVSETVRILRDVVDALAYAHGKGVVHRDIKPDNVMLADRHAAVTDLGVAKAVGEARGSGMQTTEGVAVGTPAYMAPEQALADPKIDARADLYAVGVMAYEMLTGRPVFDAGSAQGMLAAHVMEQPEPVTNVRASIPPALGAAVMRCLEKQPADRWQTADDLLAALELVATPGSGITPPSAPWTSVGRGRLAGAAATLAVIALVAWSALGRGEGDPGLDSLRVVVLPFANRTNDASADVWGDVVAEGVTRLLAQRATYLDVPARAVVEASGLGDTVPPGDVASRFQARYVLQGRYLLVGDAVRFDAELSDAVTGTQAVAIDPIIVPAGEASGGLDLVAERAAVATAAYVRPNQGASALRGWHPPGSFESLDLFDAAQDAYCGRRFTDAVVRFENAIDRDPAFTVLPITATVALASGGRGRFGPDSLVRLIEAAVPRMTRLERAYWGWLSATRRNDWEESLRQAEELERAGFGLGPYMVAISALATNRIERAAEAVERVPYDDPCMRQQASLWQTRIAAQHLAGNHQPELQAAREAVRRFPDVVARIRDWGSAGAALGNLPVVDSAAALLASVPANAGEVVGALLELGEELEVHDQPVAARRVYAVAGRTADERTPEGSWERASVAVHALTPDEALPLVRARVALDRNWVVTLVETLMRAGRTAEADSLAPRVRNREWSLVMIAATRGDGREAASALRSRIADGVPYYWQGDRALHSSPQLLNIREDPTWRAAIAPRR